MDESEKNNQKGNSSQNGDQDTTISQANSPAVDEKDSTTLTQSEMSATELNDDSKKNKKMNDEQRTEEQPSLDAEKKADVWTESPQISASGKSDASPVTDKEGEWQKDILNRLAFASVNEQRRARRWGVFFKALTFIYLGALLFYIPSDWGAKGMSGGKHTALIEIEGVIASNADANADSIVGGLRAAFKDKKTSAIILRINSPGGSPVQAGYVYDEIKRLRKKHENIKVYAVIMDVCASGGYYIAAAADEIYADKASLVGSIGVLMNSFGFVDAMKKLGVERRLLTAGKNKGILDPFRPLKKGDRKHIQKMLDGVHEQFINVVKQGRGERISENPDLYTGLFWNGDESIKLGLVDALGSSSYVAREVVGVEKIVDFTPRSNYLDRFAERIGASFASTLITVFGGELGGYQ